MKIAEMSVNCVDYMGSDLSVVNAARVSFAKQSDWEYLDSEYKSTAPWCAILSAKDTKLINYLAKHNHWSPFAHVFLSFRIKAPIFVARQLVKHQVGLSWNEVSRRYVDDEPEFWFPKEFRGRPENSKQGSTGVLNPTETGIHLGVYLNNATNDAYVVYTQLIARGVAPEQARMVLPLNTMTEWIWSGSLMAFMRVVKQRTDPHAQQETQVVANAIAHHVQELFPVSYKALLESPT
jgi:thymidylate synthase (FAD)